MVTYFNRKDLVNFGQYLLSEERTKSITYGYSEEDHEERIRNVYHADVENFLEKVKKPE